LQIEGEPGEKMVVVVIDVGAFHSHLNRFGGRTQPGSVENWPETVFQDVQTLKIPVTIVGTGESTVTLVAPTQHRQAVAAALRAVALQYGFDNGMFGAKLIMSPGPETPVSLSFRVFVRASEANAGTNEEEEIGTLAAHRGTSVRMSGFPKRLAIFPDTVESVDIIFRPDPAVVESQPGWAESWGEEVVLHNIPVKRAASTQELTRQAIHSSLRVTGVRLGAQRGRRIQFPGLDCFPTNPLPKELRMRVFIRSGEFEHEFGTLTAGTDGIMQKVGLQSPVVGFPESAQVADVIMRPFLDGLDRQLLRDHWQEELVFKNVPVIRTRPEDIPE
jgi:hypothetical protein